ncbi:MAG: hypothetical protein U0168_14605 [Nannocystaceae bacterium]
MPVLSSARVLDHFVPDASTVLAAAPMAAPLPEVARAHDAA